MNPSKMFKKNMLFLSKKKGMEIAELEECINKPEGYLADCESLNLDDCVEIATYIQAPLQDMVYIDLEKLTKAKGIDLCYRDGQWVNGRQA